MHVYVIVIPITFQLHTHSYNYYVVILKFNHVINAVKTLQSKGSCLQQLQGCTSCLIMNVDTMCGLAWHYKSSTCEQSSQKK